MDSHLQSLVLNVVKQFISKHFDLSPAAAGPI